MKKYACEGHGKDSTDFGFCEECFKKQLIIDRQKEEIDQLRSQLRYRKKKDKKEFFGSSTPSSKIEFKENSTEENRKKQGGAKKGHKGYGRKSFSREDADETIRLEVDICDCPNCGGKLEGSGLDERSIIDSFITEARKILYECQVKRCIKCGKEVTRKPLTLPSFQYGNELISNALIMHYLEGIPIGTIVKMFGNTVKKGSLIRIFHYVAEKFEPIIESLKEEYRQSEVKHADETGWRNDGKSGYAWLFCTPKMSLFQFEATRSGEIVKNILGETKTPGVLVVDRYGGYNKASCEIQYCYAHLFRDIKDLKKEFPKNREVKRFVDHLAPLFAEAMGLRGKPLSDDDYYKRAKEIQDKILVYCRSSSKHLGIHKIQDIVLDNERRLFHWVKNREIPPDNNRAERELRPSVIARKVSFGSQSAKGAKNRSILMSVFMTAAKRLQHQTMRQWIHSILNDIADNPSIDLHHSLSAIR